MSNLKYDIKTSNPPKTTVYIDSFIMFMCPIEDIIDYG